MTGIKFMFSKKATKIDEIFTVDLTLCSTLKVLRKVVIEEWLAAALQPSLISIKSTVKISSFFVAFLENTNFTFRLAPAT